MKLWKRLLLWAFLAVVPAVILPGVDPYAPTLIAVILIAAFEIGRGRILKGRDSR